jgi:hypothetical protein
MPSSSLRKKVGTGSYGSCAANSKSKKTTTRTSITARGGLAVPSKRGSATAGALSNQTKPSTAKKAKTTSTARQRLLKRFR